MRKTKKVKEIEKVIASKSSKNLVDAIALLKDCPKAKFDESVDISMKLGIDPKKADQLVRGTISLPHGTGKEIKVLVLAKGDKLEEAKKAKADFFGNEEYIEKIKSGWLEFDVIIATPEMMREVGKLGKFLGPRGLMPTPKAGTVTNDVEKAIGELKAGKIEFKADKSALVNNNVGKVSFTNEQLKDNITTIVQAINKAKPAASKGLYMKSLFISTTMGPGIEVDVQSILIS